MEKAAEALQYERAAALRDQLAALKQVQSQQIVTAEGDRDIDVFALVGEPGEYAISVMIIRGGRNLGSTCYFPKGALAEPNEALASFLMQYYAETPPPPEILVNLELAEAEALIAALGDRSGTSSRLWRPSRALPARWLAMTVENATQALRMRRARRADIEDMLAVARQVVRPRALRRSGWSVSTSVTRRVRARWPPAWSTDPKGRSRRSTGVSTSPASRPAMTTARCARH